MFLTSTKCEYQLLGRICLYSSPCPRRPPLPLVLAIVALGGGVGERGKPGSHQAGHHLPIVVVVASSLSRQNWNIWRLLGLVESLGWKTFQHVRWDPRAAVLRLCHRECWQETNEKKANHSHAGFVKASKSQRGKLQQTGVCAQKQGSQV